MSMRRVIGLLVIGIALAVPAAAGAATSVGVRHVDLSRFPLVRVTAVAPAGSRPTLLENGAPASFAHARDLGSSEALILGVDNSESMQGRPLQEAKQAAGQFLAREQGAGSTGLVVFAHDALALTRPGEQASDVAATLGTLAPDSQPGTSLYDAVILATARLRRMSDGTRLLVLLTDGRDVGSRASLSDAIAAATHADVVVYAIAAGRKADEGPLTQLTHSTGGRVFSAADVGRLSATYEALRRDLARTWQISYLTAARPGDRMQLTLRAGGQTSTVGVTIPGKQSGSALGFIPRAVARNPLTAILITGVVALLLAGAGAIGLARQRKSEIARLLDPHLKLRDTKDGNERAARLDALIDWIEQSLEEIPGAGWIAKAVERSGLQLRIGHLPILSLIGAFVLGIGGTIVGVGPLLAFLLMLVGAASPLLVLRIAAARRTKAFDRQLPDVLATIASTLRAGHGLRTALRAVADDGTPPASHELTRVLGEERLGRPLDQAITAMCDRINSPDLEYVATAINVQAQTGGSLATLFDTLSETVRERQRHARRVRALTSMGRLSATVLISLPFGLAALMTLISPAYMKPLFTTSAGHVLIIVCLTSMTIGALVLKRIVNVRY
jgi:tight adherence protein B